MAMFWFYITTVMFFFSRLIFVSEFLKNSQSPSACVILDNQYLLKDFSDLKGDEPDAHAT